MSMYAYIAGTTNNDLNDEGSIACQLDFLQQTNVDYDAYFIDTFIGASRARFQLQKLLMVVKPGDMIDVMDVSNMTSNIISMDTVSSVVGLAGKEHIFSISNYILNNDNFY